MCDQLQTPAALTAGKEPLRYHLSTNLVRPRACVNISENRKAFSPARNRTTARVCVRMYVSLLYHIHTHCILMHSFQIMRHAWKSALTAYVRNRTYIAVNTPSEFMSLNLLKPTGHVMHQQFNIQQLYVLPTLYLCVLYLSENKQQFVPLTT